MATITVVDPSFTPLVDPSVQAQTIASGLLFTEGPVWHSNDRRLIFSDIRGDTLYTWSGEKGLEIFRRPSGQANGNTYDRRGRLITCEHANRRLSRTFRSGAIEVLASHYEGKRLNSPNDVICAANGDLYFTDPPYGLRQPDGSIVGQELDVCGVYRVSPTDGRLTLLIDDFRRPNGLVLNAEETQLFIADTERHHVRVFDVGADGSLRNDRVFAELRYGELVGRPDGMKMDVAGHLYVAGSTQEGVWVFHPEGRLLGFIEVGEAPANLAWGGEDWRSLFVTARTSVYRILMNIAGMPVGS